MAIAWATQLAVDILLLGFTLYNGYVRSCTGILPRRSLLRVLVRDGAMYFLIICLAILSNILMYHFGDIITARSLSSFTVSLSVTMTCRLMLNLHAAAAATLDISDFTTPPTQMDTLRFASPNLNLSADSPTQTQRSWGGNR
ncbi:hypothetical protein DFH09DRAFT_189236 [Mycena vulgaris]|nr:hypothetical protein DFH09DRAFT_189236 [Mycena vulgaris]